MPGINIPGVTDKYNTNSTVEKLMQIERIPLTREQKTLDTYKSQQDAWKDVNKRMSSLRDSVKNLYSFDNPFNNKITTSTDENAVTADATRSAQYDSFKIDVIQTAEADRFLTSELDADTKVPAGTYTYKVNDNKVTMRWKGGSLQEFSNALNRRGNNIITTRVIGASKGKKTLSIESLKTGEENKLSFEDDAKTFAETSGMIIKVKPKSIEFNTSKSELKNPNINESNYTTENEKRLPTLSTKNISFSENKSTIPPRSGFDIDLPSNVKNKDNFHLVFTISQEMTEDITEELNRQEERPVFPDTGSASFRDVTIYNSKIFTSLKEEPVENKIPLEPNQSSRILFAVMNDGTEKEIETKDILLNNETQLDLDLNDYKGIKSISFRNENTDRIFHLSSIQAYNPNENLGFIPQHPISTSKDAIIKYEGITIKRSENKIDDVVPEVTLNLHDKTEKTATIAVKPDTESAKEALITFVGKYNQALSEINILSQNKPEVVDELDYLTDEEKEKEMQKLGMFLTDSSLTSLKSNIQSTTLANYPFSDDATVTMLSQIGIATNASNYSGYTPGKLRGYLEIDEKKLDSSLEEKLDDIKNLFGYDSDGDLIIDSGIAYRLDKQLTAYVQTGGIFSMRTNSLDTKIKASEQKITKLEAQMEQKEAELRNKYGQMEGTLNSLENQQTTISNFSKRGSGD